MTTLRQKFRKLTPEQEILLNRQVLGGTSGIVWFLAGLNVAVAGAFLIYMLCNAVLFVMQRARIWKDEQRWLAAIFLDVAMAVGTMLIEPEGMSWAYPIILWMILGNGFRFGLRWLAIASVMSTIGFGIVFASTTYWQNNQILGFGLLLGLIVVPAYCSTLIKKLSMAKDEAEAASNAKSYFLASVSHELRTPLNAIIGYGNHLKDTGLGRAQKDMVEASVLAGEHLLHLIDQLIQVAKSDVGPVKLANSDFRPTDLVAEVRDIMRVRAEEKGLSLTIQAEPFSDTLKNGPAEVIRNLLLNLVSNAIKFTESGGVSISIGAISHAEGEELHLTIRDTGIGIAADSLEKIFQPFQQADETVSSRFGGTGLGLAICKQLVDQTGGSIRVESTVGSGSRFFVTIPVNAKSHPEQVPEIEDDQNSVKVIALGNFEGETLANAQSAGNFSVLHIRCDSVEEMDNTVRNTELKDFKVALIDQSLAGKIDPDDNVWRLFAALRIAPVLVGHDREIDMEDVYLRAAFASVIPATPDFAELRSAIRIGCSFAGQKTDDAKPADDGLATNPKDVLVADDNRTNRQILATILEAAGHHVTAVEDGDEVLDILDKQEFDILLLDVNMPRLNGIETCRMWRQIEGGRTHLPIVGVTADATEETRKKCIDAGMDLRVTKPIDAKELLSLIEEKCGGDQPAGNTVIVDDPLGQISHIDGRQVNSRSSIDPQQIAYLQSIGNTAFVDEMIAGFLEDIAETEGGFEQAVSDKDVVQFRFFAHAFKSSGNNIGARRLSAICGELETITEGDFHSRGEEHLSTVKGELKRVKAELAEIASVPQQSSAG